MPRVGGRDGLHQHVQGTLPAHIRAPQPGGAAAVAKGETEAALCACEQLSVCAPGTAAPVKTATPYLPLPHNSCLTPAGVQGQHG